VQGREDALEVDELRQIDLALHSVLETKGELVLSAGRVSTMSFSMASARPHGHGSALVSWIGWKALFWGLV
jgi:hypothetical protein